jgi:hypothetical protein
MKEFCSTLVRYLRSLTLRLIKVAYSLNCIPKELGSNFGWSTDYPDLSLRNFAQTLWAISSHWKLNYRCN